MGVHEGHAFIVEAAVSVGGKNIKPGLNIHRFANRIPLLFEVCGCWYVPGAVTMQRTHVLLGQSQTCMENLQAYVLPNVHAAVHASSTAGGF